jgi:hypothetical protein
MSVRARLARHPQHRDQHQHRAEQRVEEELVARVDAVHAAPDADDEIHRDQAGLEEDVEQEQILRREHADHQRFHEQERGHIFADALFDRVPAGENADRHQEYGQHAISMSAMPSIPIAQAKRPKIGAYS